MSVLAAHRRRPRLTPPLAILLLPGSLTTVEGRAQPVTVLLSPIQDNTLYEDPGGAVSNGAGSAMFAGRNSAGTDSIRRALLAFDVAGRVPAGSRIESAALTLFNDAANVSPQTVALYRVTQSWGEGTSAATGGQGSGAPAGPGDATWLHRFFATDYWSASGGDFVASASGTAVVAGPGSYTWATTPTLVGNVQSFLDDASANFGWLLAGNETEGGTARRFATREAADATIRPLLVVEYSAIPEPAGGLLLVITGALWTAARLPGARFRSNAP